MNYDNYNDLRQQETSLFGYGLFRRSQQLLQKIDTALQGESHPQSLVDFGCADGVMLRTIVDRYRHQIGSAVGFDLFENGVPVEDDVTKFIKLNLFHDYPYPMETATVDLAIASAFFKHHPGPIDFLAEVARLLKPGGKLFLLDPTSLVVTLGMYVGYFDANWMPNRWGHERLCRMLKANKLLGKLVVTHYSRYWLAPNKRIYDLGVEGWIPGILKQKIGLHQVCICERVADH